MRGFLRDYLNPGILGTIGAVVGIGSGLSNIIRGSRGGGGGGSGSSPNFYQPTGQGTADQQWQAIQQQLGRGVMGTSNQIAGDLQSGYQGLRGLDFSGLTNAANYAGNQYAGLSSMAQQYGDRAGYAGQQAGNAMQSLLGQSGQLTGYGDQLMQLALDPQQALYKQQYQQVIDQNRAGTSARGIGMGAEAQGLENQATNNFMTQWQNQQLGRAAQGLQGATGAYGAAGNLAGQARGFGQLQGADMSSAMGFYGQAPQYAMAMGQVPFQAQQQAAMWPMQAAGMYGQALNQNVYQPLAGAQSSIIPYLNYGQGATQNQFGAYQTGLNNFTTGMQQLGQYGPQAWNTVQGWFGPGSGGGGAPTFNYSDQQPYNPGSEYQGPQFGTP